MPHDKHYKVWLDGKIVPPEDATLSVFTLTVLRGANVYEGLRAYWNAARQNLSLSGGGASCKRPRRLRTSHHASASTQGARSPGTTGSAYQSLRV